MRFARSVCTWFVALSVFVASAGLASGQVPTQQAANRGSVVGRVTTEAGAPLEAVQVRLVGTPLGAQTAADGSYRIANVSPGIYKVLAQRIGYAQRESEDIRVESGQPTTVDLQLATTVLRLQQVVISGVTDPTSGAKRPFSVAKLNAEDIPVPAIGSPTAMLAGKVAGVTVRQGGGPNGETQIQLRNPVSYRANTSPMIIVDNVIQLDNTVGGGGQGFIGQTLEIAPQDIESIEVIRGAAAAALYGQRAANGVISITTKRGASLPTGSTQLTLRTEGGFSTLGQQVPLSTHHRSLVNESNQFIDEFGRVVEVRSQRVNDPNNFIDNEWGVPIYNHIDAFFGTGQTYASSATLGQNTLSTNFNANLSGTRDGGILETESGGVENYSLRMNLDHRFNDKIRVSVGSSFNRRYADLVATGNDIFRRFLDIAPDVDIAQRDPVTGRYLPFPDVINDDEYNPLYSESVLDEWEKRAGMQVNGELSYTVTPWLTFQGLLGYQRSDRYAQLQYEIPGTIDEDNDFSVGQLDLANAYDEAANGQLAARFLNVWGGYTVRSTLQALGTIADRSDVRVFGDTLERATRDLDLTGLTTTQHVFRNQRTLSYLGTLALDYETRYIVEGLYRYDGNSLFGEGERWQPNMRASGAWSIGNEPWWPFAESVPLMKLRYSIGTAGNNPLFEDKFERYIQNAGVLRLFKERLGNDDLIPEKVTEQEIGIDASFHNRFGLELTYARQNTRDLIREDTIVAYTGFDFQVVNLGNIRGDTYEATFEAQWMSRPDFQWSSTLVADRSRSKITEYDRRCALNGFNRQCEGAVFGEMYGNVLVTDKARLSGVHQNETSLAAFDINDEGYVVAVGPGGSWRDGRWGQTVTVNGINYQWGMPIVQSSFDPVTGARIARDVVNMGQALPEMQFGLQNNFFYKGFNLFLQLNGQLGGMIYNVNKQAMYLDEIHADVDQSGKPEYAKKPSQYYTNAQSDWNVGVGGSGLNLATMMEEADYLKVAEVQLGYTFREGVPGLARLGMKRGNISLIGRNLYTITGYGGYDPEVTGNRGARVDDISYPRYRTITLQLGATF